MIRFLALLAWLLLHSVNAHSQAPIDIGKPFSGYDARQSVYFLLEEPGRSYSLDEVIARDAAAFEPMETPGIAFGFITEQVWLKFRLTNSHTDTVQRILRTDMQYLPRFRAYLVKESGEQITAADYTESTAFSERTLPSRQLAFPVELAAGESVDLYLHIYTVHNLVFDVLVQTLEEFNAYEHSLEVTIAVFVTLMFSIVAFNFIYYGLSRERLHLLFAGREFVYFIGVLHVWGFAFQFLWPDWPQWNYRAISYIGHIIILANLYFAASILNLRATSPLLLMMFQVFALADALLVASSAIYGVRILNIYGSVSILIATALIMLTSFILLKEGSLLKRYFAASNMVLLAGSAVFGIEQIFPSLLPFNGRSIVLFFILVEAIVVSVGLFKQSGLYHREGLEARTRALEQTLLAEQQSKEKVRLERDIAIAEIRRIEKEASIAKVSHDIRQPIFSAQLVLSLLKDRLPQHSDMVESISFSLNQLSAMLTEDINEFKNSTDSHFKESLNELIVGAVKLFSAQALKNRMSLRYCGTSIDVLVPAVPLTRVLSNLLVNAIAHSQADRILIGVRRRRYGSEIWVCDNGIGFQHSTSTSGDGLGLSVVRELCVRHHWGFEIATQVGKGTIFKITIRHPIDFEGRKPTPEQPQEMTLSNEIMA